MFRQLGNIVFDKAYTPDGINHKDETSYAEHALINGKPRLQPTGNNLEEEQLTVQLRAENVNITETLLALKKSKDEFEVLPYLKGTGQYIGDYVITSLEQDVIYELEDGTPIEIKLTISIKEYEVPDKLQQQQNAARKNAFAVGDKKPVRALAPQLISSRGNATQQISLAGSHNRLVDGAVRGYGNSGTLQAGLSNKIQAGLSNISAALTNATNIISALPNSFDYQELIYAMNTVQLHIPTFNFPITDVTELVNTNTALQTFMQNVKTQATTLINQVITRAA